MIEVWPAYSWIANLPATISVTVDGVTEVLTVSAAIARGLAASAAVLDVLATTLVTHSRITAASVAYDWTTAQGPRAVVTVTVPAGGPVSVVGGEVFGVEAGAIGSILLTSIDIPCQCWDGLWAVRGSKMVDFAERIETERAASRYDGRSRTQVRLGRTDSTTDTHLAVPGRWIAPRYAALAAYALQAGVSASITGGTLLDFLEAQMAGPRDVAPTGNTPWLWRHTGASDLGGTAVDLVLPSGVVDTSTLATRVSVGGRRYRVAVETRVVS